MREQNVRANHAVHLRAAFCAVWCNRVVRRRGWLHPLHKWLCRKLSRCSMATYSHVLRSMTSLSDPSNPTRPHSPPHVPSKIERALIFRASNVSISQIDEKILDRLRDAAVILNPLRELNRCQEKTAAFLAALRRRRHHLDGGARRIHERYARRNSISSGRNTL